MAFADSIRTKAATMEAVATLLESVLSSTSGLVFTTYTPTVSVVAPFTFTGLNWYTSRYVQIGKLVFFILSFYGTAGGTPGGVITVTLPVTAVSQGISAAVQITDGGAIISGCSSILTVNSIDIRRYDAAAYTVGTVGPTVYGFYEAA